MSDLRKPFPTSFETEFKPFMPGDFGNCRMGQLADEVIGRLAYVGVVLAPGLHEERMDDVKAIANAPEVIEHCPKDRTPKRFFDKTSTGFWLPKEGGRQAVGAYHLNAWSGEPLSLDELATVNVNDITQNSLAWIGKLPEDERDFTDSDITSAFRSTNAGSELLSERIVNTPGARRVTTGYGAAVILLAMTTEHYGIEPGRLSLQCNESNGRAGRLYGGRLGFAEEPDVAPRVFITRPTLEPIGTIIGDYEVRQATDDQGAAINVVDDWRIAMRWRGPDFVTPLTV